MLIKIDSNPLKKNLWLGQNLTSAKDGSDVTLQIEIYKDIFIHFSFTHICKVNVFWLQGERYHWYKIFRFIVYWWGHQNTKDGIKLKNMAPEGKLSSRNSN